MCAWVQASVAVLSNIAESWYLSARPRTASRDAATAVAQAMWVNFPGSRRTCRLRLTIGSRTAPAVFESGIPSIADTGNRRPRPRERNRARSDSYSTGRDQLGGGEFSLSKKPSSDQPQVQSLRLSTICATKERLRSGVESHWQITQARNSSPPDNTLAARTPIDLYGRKGFVGLVRSMPAFVRRTGNHIYAKWMRSQ